MAILTFFQFQRQSLEKNLILFSRMTPEFVFKKKTHLNENKIFPNLKMFESWTINF